MKRASNGQEWPRMGEIIEAFEAALARDGAAALADFVPRPDHPDRLKILCELVRVDLEHQWQSGQPPPLEHYRKLFPAVFEDPELLGAIAYEEFRLRQQAGEHPAPSEYAGRYGLEGCNWPVAADSPSEDRPGREDSDRLSDPADGMARAAAAYRAYRREGTEQDDKLDLYFSSWHAPPECALLLQSLDRTAPHRAQQLAEALGGLPRPGTDFLGFRICSELGRGAFGRVYLARQGDLADRLVTLKVSADVSGESRALAQLQHTNIVPIYSVHRRGPLHAVCMPYLGATTLADTLASIRSQAVLPKSGNDLLSTLHSKKIVPVAEESRLSQSPALESVQNPAGPGPPPKAISSALEPRSQPVATQVGRLRGMGYVQAVIWLMERVAEGLAHAHEHGILHRDLKPANILFADDGEPVLLDFNLAADTKAGLRASIAVVGGTLPYMAPEHLSAFRDGKEAVDPRSDIFALGVIFHELLTSNHPFPLRTGPVADILPEMIRDRLGPVPDARSLNRAVTPATAAIVRHCLEANPSRRYQSARELQEDLERQLENRLLTHVREPSIRERLAKWTRRHPRLSSSTTVGVVSLLLLAGLGAAYLLSSRQFQRVESNAAYRWLANERRQAIAFLTPPYVDRALAEEGLLHCNNVAKRYAILENPAWRAQPLVAHLSSDDRAQLSRDVGDLLVLWAKALTRRAAGRNERERAQDIAAAIRRLDLAESCFGSKTPPVTLLLARADLMHLTGDSETEQRLRSQIQRSPLGTELDRLIWEDPDRIDPEFGRQFVADEKSLVVRDPQNWAVWLALGNWNVRLHRVARAQTDFSVAVALAPRSWGPPYNRGLLFLDLKDHSRALEDFEQVVSMRPDLPEGYLNRALAKLGLGDARGAADDLTICLGLEGAPSRAWFIRAEARRRLGELEGARHDRDQGLKEQPSDPAGFVARGVARLHGDSAGALADFEGALAIDPRFRFALQSKAHVLGEVLGRGDEALKVLDTLLQFHPDQVEAMCGRGVQLARFGRRDPALRDAGNALKLDDSALTTYQVACIHALLAKKDPPRSRDALRLLSESVRKDRSWIAVARTDPDMAAIRGLPAFEELLRGAEAVFRAGSK
jgi:eukaryotic-like serine/threonine-protein kinase